MASVQLLHPPSKSIAMQMHQCPIHPSDVVVLQDGAVSADAAVALLPPIAGELALFCPDLSRKSGFLTSTESLPDPKKHQSWRGPRKVF